MLNVAPILVGDGIENPGNALAMLHVAEMYGVECRFHDTKGLQQSKVLEPIVEGRFPATTGDEIKRSHTRIIAFDNLWGAADVYGFSAGKSPAVLVGNERRGLSHSFRHIATDAVLIPMASRQINTLNVAAASAVALHYLCHVRVGPMAKVKHPERRRPQLLLLGAEDPIELGSTIRSAAAFGWRRVFIEDRTRVWFGSDRITRSEGRAAARRSRNPIGLIPWSIEVSRSFSEVTIVTTSPIGVPLHRANLARGPRHLVVIPDESQGPATEGRWTQLGQRVEFAHLSFPAKLFTYHYRLVATVALAEVSRQVGSRPTRDRGEGDGTRNNDQWLRYAPEMAQSNVSLEDLPNH